MRSFGILTYYIQFVLFLHQNNSLNYYVIDFIHNGTINYILRLENRHWHNTQRYINYCEIQEIIYKYYCNNNLSYYVFVNPLTQISICIYIYNTP